MSTAILQFRIISTDYLQELPQALSLHLVNWKPNAFTVEFLRDLVLKRRLYPDESFDKRIRQARRDIVFKIIRDSRFPKGGPSNLVCCYELGFVYSDPVIAELAAEDVVTQFFVGNDDYNRAHFPNQTKCGGDCSSSGFQILDPPKTGRRRLIW